MVSQRDRWSGRSAFILAAIGSAVGLGNVISFPARCYDNGGGAFFIPYLVALLTAGIPLLILEFGIGQMMQTSAPNSMKKLNKHSEWVGWFALLVAAVITVYYSVLMAWAMEFIWYSFAGLFSGGVPWAESPGTFFTEVIRKHSSVKGELWEYHIPIILGLLATWIMVFVIICKGVHRVGKVVKWSVPIPIAVLIILIIRGVTLEGAADGIKFYLTPDISKLTDAKTWLAAYGQIFFSLTLGFGVMIAYASYRPKKSDITNSAFITAFANCATSFIAGFAVFSVIGFLKHEDLSAPQGGLGLAFITYPTAIAEMGAPFGAIVGILFFVMLLALGIDSLFSLVEGVVAALRDRYPSISQVRTTGVICVVGFILSTFFFANRAGTNWLDCFDHWTQWYGLAVVGLLQCVIAGYFFDLNELRDYINEVSEIKLWGWWELCIKVITPAILVFLIGKTLLDDLSSGRIYGMSKMGDAAFDDLAWVPAVIFVSLFAFAFLMAQMWSYLAMIFSGLVVFGIMYLLLGECGAAIFTAIASSVLIGGLVLCLNIARKNAGNETEYDALE